MKNSQLIKLLQEFPQDMEVRIIDHNRREFREVANHITGARVVSEAPKPFIVIKRKSLY